MPFKVCFEVWLLRYPFYFATSGLIPHNFDCAISILLVNIVIGIVAFLVYVCVARRYKYRMRDEPSHVHRYAEEYYSKRPKTVS